MITPKICILGMLLIIEENIIKEIIRSEFLRAQDGILKE